MARFRLIPREERFYVDFVAMADQIRAGAHLLVEMLRARPPAVQKAAEIKEIEHHCDFLTHEIVQRLNRTFVTPIDREDIHELASVLDDVMDAIDASAGLFSLYRITDLRYGALELAEMIERQAEVIVKATPMLEKRKGVLELSAELNRLEHEADEIYRTAVGRLFDEERDPIAVIKWKEILRVLEEATDRCEDVGNVLETIVVKHG
jgi:predicted phosphate transport protein (TIGR00153 family)